MNTKKQRWILYFITATIVTTIAVQLYWNYKNYEENKRQVTNEIQISLDNAIEEYYSSLAKNKFITILGNSDPKIDKSKYEDKNIDRFKITDIKITPDESFSEEKKDSMINEMKSFVTNFNRKQDSIRRIKLDSSRISNTIKNKKVFTPIKDNKEGFTLRSDGSKTKVKYFTGKKAADSINSIKNLKPIFISLFDKKIEYEKIDSLLEKQLKQKGIVIKNSFVHTKKDSIFYMSDSVLINNHIFEVNAKSTYFKDNETFKLKYSNPSFEALKRSSTGILLSLLLSLAVISSLFYLLKIINQQKELAEIKNDLISNITHEFKTPITTVSTALEAIDNFNAINDKEKTKKYVSISNVQLKKLHQMVEKLLETATLDSENLMLQKEENNVVDLIDKITKKHQLISENKTITFSSNISEITTNIDVFHFENAISNLIDNAIKYGGSEIEVNLNSVLNTIEISVADNGTSIEKNQQEKIFDKFYRVPKGNTHDVKGFGIGLYYTKKIIEKHNGIINLVPNIKNTVFKIILPNE